MVDKKLINAKYSIRRIVGKNVLFQVSVVMEAD